MTQDCAAPRATAREALALAEAGGRPDDQVAAALARRGIQEVLHFTTNLGLIGVLGSGLLLSRARLPEDRYLEHVYRPNSPIRKDMAWLDFVNLSVSRINDWMFGSSERWHAQDEVWWAALAFDPLILAEPGVVFTTTNNIYPSVHRHLGAAGLEEMFSPIVLGRYGTRHGRNGLSDSQPTDRQAEVLFPKALSTWHLKTIYVRDEENVDSVEGIFGGLPGVDVPVVVQAGVFE